MLEKSRAKTKKTKTTRETKFNSYTDTTTHFVDTIVSATATNTNPNIRLLDASDGVRVSGELIISHAKANKTMVEMGYNVVITDEDLAGINSGSTYYVFGAPHKIVLDNRQAYNNCGVESTMNTLVTAGKIKIKDQNSTEKNFLKQLVNLGMVQDDGKIGVLDTADGGTLPPDYKEIFEYYGFDSDSYFIENQSNPGNLKQYSDIGELGRMVSAGCGVVIGLSSSKLWKSADSESDKITIDHAVAVIGAVYDGADPSTANLLGFYIHDTGAWMTRYISVDGFKDVTLYSEYGAGSVSEDTQKKTGEGIFVTFTNEPIKYLTDNINATGNGKANIIYGNSADNTIKGAGGNDTLYGGEGNDKIYGGSGDDIIFGNGVDEDEVADFKSRVSDAVKSKLTNVNPVRNTEADKTFVGRNVIYGDSGSDIIFGGEQNDLIYGGAGNDYIYTGNGKNAAYGGSGNDVIFGGAYQNRLFGEAGNDIIFGGDDCDVIHGGAGNDTIYGGKEDDRIECGSGNDTVVFEANQGEDEISSTSGTVTLRVEHTVFENISADLSDNNDNDKIKNLKFNFYENEKDSIEYLSFFNTKKNQSQSVTLEAKNMNGDYVKYLVKASNSAKASVGDTSTKKGHTDINNILFTTGLKNTTITTSTKNDFVVMKDAGEYDARDLLRKDTITYTGGEDVYLSLVGDTTYNVKSFDENTNLAIRDNVELLKKTDIDEEDEKVTTIIPPSANDSIKFNTNFDDLVFFFDIEKSGTDLVVSDNTDLFVLNKASGAISANVIAEIVDTNDVADGSVGIEAFFKKDASLYGDDYYGNGRIEYFATNDAPSFNIAPQIDEIRYAVAGWFTENEGYTSVYDAIANDAENVDALIACYTGDMMV